MGVKKGEDFPEYEKSISIGAAELKIIMGWINQEESMHDYRLTEQQMCDIEKATALTLPRNLDLYLTSES
ncbi:MULTISPECIES: hypothetical protein [unclassified Pseudomonas]|uniref:hypothetical protein n=1 Tax=unclassified Pseudomonas TaxID=196821 RepID=UPI0014827936|nr:MULTISPECIES: hypothetical protein [unclassified Pseudomonas]